MVTSLPESLNILMYRFKNRRVDRLRVSGMTLYLAQALSEKMSLGSNSLKTSLPFLLQVIIGHLMLWFQPISYPFSHSHFGGSVDGEILM